MCYYKPAGQTDWFYSSKLAVPCIRYTLLGNEIICVVETLKDFHAISFNQKLKYTQTIKIHF